MVFNNRLFIGLFILIFVCAIFFLNLNYFFLIFLLFFVCFELYNIDFIKFDKNFFIQLTLLLFFIFLLRYIQNIHLILIITFLTTSTIVNKNLIRFLFPISIFLFFYILLMILKIDKNLFYLIFFISFFNDTLAYIFGRLVKGPLIIPKISPKKTWSGTTISFLLSFSFLIYYDFNTLESILLSLSLFLGDLYFSYIKRSLNLKDFSKLLYSHGGFLDRLDSMYLFSIILLFFSL